MIVGVMYSCRCGVSQEINLPLDQEVLDVPRKLCKKCQIEMSFRLVDKDVEPKLEPKVEGIHVREEVKV